MQTIQGLEIPGSFMFMGRPGKEDNPPPAKYGRVNSHPPQHRARQNSFGAKENFDLIINVPETLDETSTKQDFGVAVQPWTRVINFNN